MNYNPYDVTTWGIFHPLLLAHDVGRTRDRSTAVIGGNSPGGEGLIGLREAVELPQQLYGSGRANALAEVDRRWGHNALVIADLSNDASYAEVLQQTFGPRVIGLQISRSGDGTVVERRPCGHGAILVYTVGRSFLIEQFHGFMQANQVRFAAAPELVKAFEQLSELDVEHRQSGTVYTCRAGKHDDLGISCAMLAWAARHRHLSTWFQIAAAARRPRRPRPKISWEAWI
ncbi:hypothetical protein [Bradyrhizobium elkanii]|uniref:Uncharacterized protein n=1 Tax=Bradyrhizobium elkanii TaxID=29448 RepID=A0ABV4EXK3_BRAEL|nr:hypothetical protein [Bradyrhizobium elkanii]MCP1756901.1 hypothetical protein [Bradyrhizobium elkanii]MCP1982414.1 hypothetical protein [Bradyrhizobium elkanii]MCS3882802.1 hypothetical protein [Bradyrhizobium elkanii]MCS4218141.1 hypothetical protein [Bradyrhizobium elkanii]MCW2195409.1 hypothetical protein [Bradyrhizobium elkanii]